MTALPFDRGGLERVPGVGSWEFDDTAVEFAIDIVRRSGVVSQLEAWRAEERERLGRHGGGAPEGFPPEALMVAMALAALHRQPMLATTFGDILFRHLSPAMRARLGVREPPADDDARGWEAIHRAVLRRFHSLLDAVDPSPLPKNRRYTPDQFEAATLAMRAEQELTDEVLASRLERLTWLANALLTASTDHLSPEIRAQWHGSVAVDATPVPAFARAERRERTRRGKRGAVVVHAADPDAGYYVRADDEPGTARGERNVRDAIWSHEATLVVSGNDDPSCDQPVPCLVEAMAPLHRPGVAVGNNAVRALTSLATRGQPACWLAGDRAYSNAKPEHFQLPVRALGYRPVFDYTINQLGVQDSCNGALQIEGAWYCPAIPEILRNATKDYREGKIDEVTWRARIDARRPYRVRPKERPDAEGHRRQLCPASNAAYTGRCELKPDSIKRTDASTMRIPVTDAQRLQPPVVCSQQSSTFPPEAGAKLAQDLHYGSEEWRGIYNTLRNTVEGFNGVAKDGAFAALGDPSRRRIRGTAPQTLFTALLLMAANIRSIDSFRLHALPDATGTLRKGRKRRRATPSLSTWTPTVVARAGAPPE